MLKLSKHFFHPNMVKTLSEHDRIFGWFFDHVLMNKMFWKFQNLFYSSNFLLFSSRGLAAESEESATTYIILHIIDPHYKFVRKICTLRDSIVDEKKLLIFKAINYKILSMHHNPQHTVQSQEVAFLRVLAFLRKFGTPKMSCHIIFICQYEENI